MATYIVRYTLSKPGHDYARVDAIMKSYGNGGRIFDATWLMQTGETAEEIFSKLAPALDSNDRIFISRLAEGPDRNACWGNFSEQDTKWIQGALLSEQGAQ